jgi:hypothetical protein
MIKKLWSENLKGRDHAEDLGVGGRIIPEWILRDIKWEDINWIHLDQNRDR